MRLKFHKIQQILANSSIKSRLYFNLTRLQSNRRHFVPISPQKVMSKNPNLLKPPQQNGTILSKSMLEKSIATCCLKFCDVKISDIVPILKKYLLKMENFKPVQSDENGNTVIYLNPEIVTSWTDLVPEDRDKLENVSISERNVENISLILKYENYSAESLFRAFLPDDKEGVSSFTKTGHIVHVNLREHLLPFKEIIGQILFDKVPGCRTVVNKINNIDNTYRNFQMEILKGEPDMLTEVKENKCIFKFDFSKVYWNSRLCTEHERVVQMIPANSVVYDVFAGVGPFAVPLAKKKCVVYANDLNPDSFHWLNFNSKLNKVQNCNFHSFNKDGGDFIKNEVKNTLPLYLGKKNIFIIMNLPAMGIEFLSYFIGLLDHTDIFDPLTVIVYCFAKGEDCENIAKKLFIENLPNCRDVESKIIDIFKVRTVSSMKEMMRITFKLDFDILVNNKRKQSVEDENSKKLKICNLHYPKAIIIKLFLQVIMGKNKKKTNSIFKVAGAKSLKLKSKAKAVKSELKQVNRFQQKTKNNRSDLQLNIKNKSKIQEIDKALIHLQDEIRKPGKNSQKPDIIKTKLPKSKKSVETCQTVETLEAMQI